MIVCDYLLSGACWYAGERQGPVLRTACLCAREPSLGGVRLSEGLDHCEHVEQSLGKIFAYVSSDYLVFVLIYATGECRGPVLRPACLRARET